jgi:HTH-type transcriptional regulator/antitoxin HigA
MDITPIKTKRDYRRVLKEIEGLMGAKRNSPDGDRLDVLVTLVEAFERKHYPLDLPDRWRQSGTTWTRTGFSRAT